jgi:fumarate reductase iron-sulfur subunit
VADRTLTFSVFRYNPYDPDFGPRMQEYILEETPRMTLFTALTRIREEMDPSLQFDFVCRSATCGSCAMLVNGHPRLACRTRTGELPGKIILHPLPFFRLIGDLSVDTGSWFAEMAHRVESWVHSAKGFNPNGEEERMANEQALAVYELERCIECGCCVAACATAQMRDDFLGAAGLLRIARFWIDSRDQRTDADFFDVVGTDAGVFGCVGLLACQDYCPKNLPLMEQLAYLRRRMMLASLSLAVSKKDRGSKEGAAIH